jgi:hypothetical protein
MEEEVMNSGIHNILIVIHGGTTTLSYEECMRIMHDENKKKA